MSTCKNNVRNTQQKKYNVRNISHLFYIYIYKKEKEKKTEKSNTKEEISDAAVQIQNTKNDGRNRHLYG